MKLFTIPLINVCVEMYTGRREWNRYVTRLNKDNGSFPKKRPYPGPRRGECAGSFFWVDVPDRRLVFHELSHISDNLFDYIDCKNEAEFKAEITSNLYDQVIAYIIKKEHKNDR